MNTITVRLNAEESQAYQEFAKLNGIPLSTLLNIRINPLFSLRSKK